MKKLKIFRVLFLFIFLFVSFIISGVNFFEISTNKDEIKLINTSWSLYQIDNKDSTCFEIKNGITQFWVIHFTKIKKQRSNYEMVFSINEYLYAYEKQLPAYERMSFKIFLDSTLRKIKVKEGKQYTLSIKDRLAFFKESFQKDWSLKIYLDSLIFEGNSNRIKFVSRKLFSKLKGFKTQDDAR